MLTTSFKESNVQKLEMGEPHHHGVPGSSLGNQKRNRKKNRKNTMIRRKMKANSVLKISQSLTTHSGEHNGVGKAVH